MSADLPYRPCAGVVLMNAEGRIFAGQRIDNGGLSSPAWQMPQGGIDKGEDADVAALRELWEETGVTYDLVDLIAVTQDWVTYDLPPELLGKVWKGKYRGQKQKWYLFRFKGDDRQINIETDHPEFSSWRWMSPEDLVASIVPFKRAVYEEVFAEFAPQIRAIA